MKENGWHILAAIVLVIVGIFHKTLGLSDQPNLEELIGLVALTTFLVGFSQLRTQSALEDLRGFRSTNLSRVLEQNRNQADLLPLPTGLIAGLTDRGESSSDAEQMLFDRTAKTTLWLAAFAFLLGLFLWRTFDLRFVGVHAIHLVVVILGFATSDSVRKTAEHERIQSPFAVYNTLQNELVQHLKIGDFDHDQTRLRLERRLDELERVLPDWVWSTLLRCTLNLEKEQAWPDGSVRVATTAKVNPEIDIASGKVIDGVTLVSGDKVLVKDQGELGLAHKDNGIYEVPMGFIRSKVRSRAPIKSPNSPEKSGIESGAIFFVEEGKVNSNKLFTVAIMEQANLGPEGIAFTMLSREPKKSSELAVAEVHLDRIYRMAESQRDFDDFALLAFVWSAYLREAYSSPEAPFLASYHVKNSDLNRLYKRGLMRGIKRELHAYSVYSELAFKTAAWVIFCKRGLLKQIGSLEGFENHAFDAGSERWGLLFPSPIHKVFADVSSSLREQGKSGLMCINPWQST